MTAPDPTSRYTVFDHPTGDDVLQATLFVRAPYPQLDDTIAKVNAKLVLLQSGWRFTVDADASRSRLIPIELTHTQPLGGRPIPNAESAFAVWETYAPGLPILIDPGPHGLPGYKPGGADPTLFGLPGYKPGALTRGDFGRVPVGVVASPPPRPAVPAPARRPIVALLDTHLHGHPWLGRPDAELGGDGFWVDARGLGWAPGSRLTEPVDLTGTIGRELLDQEGHGTFSAGLIRQIAPQAQVLAVHVIGESGAVYGDHVVNALGWIVDSGYLTRGDVVCMPLGFQPVWPRDLRYLEWLGDVLGELADLGIKVVAAAGNDGDEIPVYPAAFAASAGVPADVRLISVGALAHDGVDSPYLYLSNYGPWVTQWTVGGSLVSTFPPVNAVARAELTAGHADRRAVRSSADPDDFRGGFARWSGTSFAAVVHAARLAAAGTPTEPGTEQATVVDRPAIA